MSVGLAERAREELGALGDRRADLAVVVRREHRAQSPLDLREAFALRGHDVMKSFDAMNGFHRATFGSGQSYQSELREFKSLRACDARGGRRARQRPSETTRTAPSSAVFHTVAPPRARRRDDRGRRKPEAIVGAARDDGEASARRRRATARVLEVALPWCGTLRTSLARRVALGEQRRSAPCSMSPVKSTAVRPKRERAARARRR